LSIYCITHITVTITTHIYYFKYNKNQAWIFASNHIQRNHNTWLYISRKWRGATIFENEQRNQCTTCLL